jgi:hypothetical protein
MLIYVLIFFNFSFSESKEMAAAKKGAAASASSSSAGSARKPKATKAVVSDEEDTAAAEPAAAAASAEDVPMEPAYVLLISFFDSERFTLMFDVCRGEKTVWSRKKKT